MPQAIHIIDILDEIQDGTTYKRLAAVDSSNQATTESIADDAITSALIDAGAVDTTALDALAVTGAKVANTTITGGKLVAKTVDTGQIADSAIESLQILDANITKAKLGSDCVDGTKIEDDAVDSEHIATGAVDLGHMSANSIDSDQYVDGSIDTVHLAGAAVTDAKRSAVTIEAVTAASNTISADENRKVLTNDGATAEVVHTLPTASAGLTLTFIVSEAYNVKITAAAGDTIRLGGEVSKAAGYVSADTVGSMVILIAIDATQWIATSFVGTWTVEIS